MIQINLAETTKLNLWKVTRCVACTRVFHPQGAVRRRCPECQERYRELSGGAGGQGKFGGGGRRPAGHNTRGIHKPRVR